MCRTSCIWWETGEKVKETHLVSYNYSNCVSCTSFQSSSVSCIIEPASAWKLCCASSHLHHSWTSIRLALPLDGQPEFVACCYLISLLWSPPAQGQVKDLPCVMAYVKGFCYVQCRQEWKNTRVWCIPYSSTSCCAPHWFRFSTGTPSGAFSCFNAACPHWAHPAHQWTCWLLVWDVPCQTAFSATLHTPLPTSVGLFSSILT